MAIGFEEKRLTPRIRLNNPLRYQVRGAGEFNSTLSDDISLGGVGLLNSKFIAPKTPVNLEINVLSRVLRPAGMVAWSSPLPHSMSYRLGIRFLEFDLKEKRYLKDYMDMQLGKL